MQSHAQFAKYGWFTGSPANVNGSVYIGVRFMIAGAAPKLVLGASILFCAVATCGTGATGVTGVHGDHGYSSQFGLVLHKKSQLRECPRMQNGTLLSPGLYPFEDAAKFFYGDTAFGAFSFGNDLLGNTVVGVGCEASFAPGKISQASLCRTRVVLLEFRTQPSMAMAYRFGFAATVSSSVRGGGYIGNPQIHAKKFGWADRSATRQIYGTVQEELAFPVDQIGLSFDAVEALALILAIDQGNDNAPFRKRPQAYPVYALEAKYSFIVCDRSMRFERWASCFVASEAFYRLSDSPNRHLSGESVALSDFSVGQFVNRWLTEHLGIKSLACGKSGGLI